MVVFLAMFCCFAAGQHSRTAWSVWHCRKLHAHEQSACFQHVRASRACSSMALSLLNLLGVKGGSAGPGLSEVLRRLAPQGLLWLRDSTSAVVLFQTPLFKGARHGVTAPAAPAYGCAGPRPTPVCNVPAQGPRLFVTCRPKAHVLSSVPAHGPRLVSACWLYAHALTAQR